MAALAFDRVSRHYATPAGSTYPVVERGNRAAAMGLARAIVKTLEWMHTHSEQEIADKMPAAIRGDAALYGEALRGSRPMFATDGTMSAEGAAVVRDVLATFNPKVRAAAIDLSKTYTNDLLATR